MNEINVLDKLSIIVPVYNVEKYVGKCLDSLVGQFYLNCEIIVINDGSTDGSLEICKRYSELDNRIKVYSQKNGGLSDARNYGVNLSSGKYITFVDSDDYVHPNIYVALIQRMKKKKSQIACCNIYMVYDNYICLKHDITDNHTFTPYEAMKNVLSSGGTLDFAAWNKVYESNLFNEIRFPKGKIYEDMHIMLEVFNECESISLISEPLYYYRQRSMSITKLPLSFKNFDVISAYERMIAFLKENSIHLEEQAKRELLMAKLELIRQFSKNDVPMLKNSVIDVKKSIKIADFKNFISNSNRIKLLLIYLIPIKILHLLLRKNA